VRVPLCSSVPPMVSELGGCAVRSTQLEPRLGLTEDMRSARLKWHGKASGWHPLWRTQRRA
jgi:hypothetical protein